MRYKLKDGRSKRCCLEVGMRLPHDRSRAAAMG